MVGWESITNYKIFSYFKKYFDLNKKEKALTEREEKVRKEEKRQLKLHLINNQNSEKYSKMVDLYPSNLNVTALDSIVPYLEFQFNITNRSILDFKTKNFFIKVLHSENMSEIGQIEVSRELDLPHQKFASTKFKLQLHPNFVSKLKLLRKEHKSLQIQLADIKIVFTGDKNFYLSENFNLKISWDEINVK